MRRTFHLLVTLSRVIMRHKITLTGDFKTRNNETQITLTGDFKPRNNETQNYTYW